MNKIYTLKFSACLLALIGILLLNSCKKDNNRVVKETDLSITLTAPPSLTLSKLGTATVTFTEVNSGAVVKTTTSDSKFTSRLPEGSYNVSLETTSTYTKDGETFTSKIRGYKEGLVARGNAISAEIALFLFDENANFVIREIFFTGTVTPEGKQYEGDKYIVIYNNSDQVLYADGLVIAQSAFLTTAKRAYTPDVMATAFSAGDMIIIPGSGKEHPVAPGKSITVANNAINHLEYNKNSVDLRKADFEMVTTTVDNPEVPNTVLLTSFFAMHNRGFRSYVLARFNGTADDFKEKNAYNYTYKINTSNITLKGYQIPNTQIIDAVNLSVPAAFQWIVTDPSLDMGWSYCGKTDGDINRYRKSVQRKVLSTTASGREILKDTNNSTVDFDAERTPSLFK